MSQGQTRPSSPTTARRRGPALNPWEPYQLRKADCIALKNLEAGNASERQQKHILDLLLNISGVRDLEFRPGGDDGRRASDFASGKRFVGLQIVKAVTLPAAVVDKLD